VELGTPRVAEYIAFFEDVAGFRVIHKEARYAELNSGLGELLLIDPQELPRGHPFHARLTGSGQGLGVEIGLVVADLDRAYAAALKHKGFPISTGIVRRPWGVRDFRVLAPDGYYLRFTEGPKPA
jgi:catechol 2,3-dioxygenase-like lactoylglutathione lyase family enzyme